jgi:hypothetical protein
VSTLRRCAVSAERKNLSLYGLPLRGMDYGSQAETRRWSGRSVSRLREEYTPRRGVRKQIRRTPSRSLLQGLRRNSLSGPSSSPKTIATIKLRHYRAATIFSAWDPDRRPHRAEVAATGFFQRPRRAAAARRRTRRRARCGRRSRRRSRDEAILSGRRG